MFILLLSIQNTESVLSDAKFCIILSPHFLNFTLLLLKLTFTRSNLVLYRKLLGNKGLNNHNAEDSDSEVQ